MNKDEEKMLGSPTVQESEAVLLARESTDHRLILEKKAFEHKLLGVAERCESFRVALSSIGDAVITTDTETRITFMNPVAEAMTGWKSDEVIGQPIQQAFNIVNEETRAPAPNPVTEALREDVAVGLALHSALIARDGRETPIEDSTAPIRDSSGKTCGVVMVFHDVTKQRQAEITLCESNKALGEARDDLQKQVQERTAELRVANHSLSDLSARLLRMRDDERRRLARELHDSVGQLLAALSMNLAQVQSQAEKLDSEGARAIAENAVLVQQISDEVRTIAHLLHPPLLDEVGLASALRWYVEGFSERSKIAVELEIEVEFGRLGDDMEIAIFRIVQECLTNVYRHSGGGTAGVLITHSEGRVRVEIKDSGNGIPVEKLKALRFSGEMGVGFRGMRERIAQLGGSFEIESGKFGTAVKTSMPVQKVPGTAATEQVA